jgi:hypothetical protein
MKKLAALALALSLLPACASTEAGDYLSQRGGDLVDILRGHVTFGKAAAVKADAFRLIHAGIGWESDARAWGLANRELAAWRESVFTWGLVLGHHDERSVTGTIDGKVSGSYGWTFGEKGNAFQVADEGNMLDMLTVRGTVMLGIGIDLEVRVGEVIDFVCGIFRFDPAGDDLAPSKLKKPT